MIKVNYRGSAYALQNPMALYVFVRIDICACTKEITVIAERERDFGWRWVLRTNNKGKLG